MEMAIPFQPFDCCNRLHDFAEGDLAGTAWGTADQDRAGAALPFSAAVFCAREAEFIAENGQQASIWIGVDWIFPVVDFQFEWRSHGASRRADFLAAATCET